VTNRAPEGVFRPYLCRLRWSPEGRCTCGKCRSADPSQELGAGVCIKRDTDELCRCQEVAAVGALDLVERVGGEDDAFQIRVGPGGPASTRTASTASGTFALKAALETRVRASG
jgi:hypothetical protein